MKRMKTQIQKPQDVSHTVQAKTRAANQAPMDQVLQRYRDKIVQREALPDKDKLLQGKFAGENLVQRETTPNNTGLPDNLKSSIENLSGYSMNDVRVHYNSSKPAQLQALAYTQGADIHVAPGQEEHLPHEAWHVVQQKQGRVQPTMQLQGVSINDNEGLEKEADVMPLLFKKNTSRNDYKNISTNTNTIQKVLVTDVPNTGDFSNITDLGIWWGMAAEFHFQQNLPANGPNAANLNPLNYIKSLSDYLPGAIRPQINVNAGDSVRMQAHGDDPNGGNTVVINGNTHNVNGIINNINQQIAGGGGVTPLYCYMGNNPNYRHLIPGIGGGPMLSPSIGSVSLNNNVQNILQQAGAANTWNNIIDNTGSWLPIYNVPNLSPLFQNYRNSVVLNGANNPLTIQHLQILLIEIYNEVNQPYNDFAQYLIGQNASSGQGQTLWQ
jgi:hypothetical protein